MPCAAEKVLQPDSDEEPNMKTLLKVIQKRLTSIDTKTDALNNHINSVASKINTDESG